MKRSSDSTTDQAQTTTTTETDVESAEDADVTATETLGDTGSLRQEAVADLRSELGNKRFQQLVESGELEDHLPEERR